jgi:hypothetical protein
MKHRPAPLLWRGSRLARQLLVRLLQAALCAAALACGDARGSLVILSDTTAAPAVRVVVALPFDPAMLPSVAAAPLPDGPHGDSVRLAIARHDSAARADVLFQRARTAANDAARSLAPLDRSSGGYAARYSAWSALADSAERLRATRDRVRQRLKTLSTRLGPAAPELNGGVHRTRSRTSADSGARAAGLELQFATLRGGSARVSLPPGEWWIACTTMDGALILPAVRVQIEAGDRDTVVLRPEPVAPE